ncbi:hypothetical protein D8674_008677 [Pyrus ussuriensis x Pyrus communis]|uniref:Uncharacterized protein n=1 Tax=Pyrus ussuriensis x Pyrus communis TaxID=2448454 RepID=A0A5N5HUE2_9ROSA|nr:hypothetical protein D8674_008677 [Pyrus ussuriensis x Pyrus communis]
MAHMGVRLGLSSARQLDCHGSVRLSLGLGSRGLKWCGALGLSWHDLGLCSALGQRAFACFFGSCCCYNFWGW